MNKNPSDKFLYEKKIQIIDNYIELHTKQLASNIASKKKKKCIKCFDAYVKSANKLIEYLKKEKINIIEKLKTMK